MPRVRRCRQPGCHAMVNFPDHYCKQHYEHEAEYLASRERWARSHDKHYMHKYNTITRNRDDSKRQQYNFYRTRQWSHLRQQVLERDHYLCAYCKVQGIITPATTVDHIVPIEYDQALKANVDNLAIICGKCHRMKTDWEQSYYGMGQGNHIKKVPEIKDVQSVVVFLAKSI
ncbi:HNH endonuclease [Levilactobacillus brevis]|uniref:HNH endonuclease n=1 Tax=Levilactobacillus brevis TaxID=1580 RepID=UPI001C10D5CC|nr:HNH endonuclease [Levilactobacillus brevis]MBU5275377.1 HNH endonuclease [Levilactobacillus brevis]